MSPRPACLALALLASAGAASASAVDRDVMNAWRAYAQSAITPDFTWSGTEPAAAPSLRTAARVSVQGGAALDLALGSGLSLRVVEQAPSQLVPATRLGSLAQVPPQGLVSNGYVSSLSAELPGAGRFGLSAVMSQQRFLTPGMGKSQWNADGRLLGALFSPAGEVVSGFGVRAELDLPAGRDAHWTVSMQSRIDMDAFKSYRGVYSEPGDFDIPGQAGLRYARSLGRNTLSVGVDRIFYSEVSAVTGYGLPNRLLSLLGDGGSPEFAWRDLTVYSAGWEYAAGEHGTLSLRYSTRLQPSPTSLLLQRAMERDFSDRNLALGYRHDLGRLGRLQFTASHSGASYFVGPLPLRQSSFGRGGINEFEVLWALPF